MTPPLKPSLSRRLLMPALLAVAVAPLALTATAFPDKAGDWSEERQERMEEHREALFERAGIDEATREALAEARDEHHQALRELHEQHRERLGAILDEQQREALQVARRELREEYRAERREARQQRLTELVDGWGLSDAERAQLTEVRESFYAGMRALRDREFDSRKDRRDAWQALREEHHAALGELLSDEQIAELKAAMAPRGRHGHGRHHGHPHHFGKGDYRHG